ncbi:MAG: undecaprenyl/decaprenyl-phosphate alpha-N-acetylglucosaminyl 1-phosphate transferase [Clostridia bacterium]|nr:undecaprenyl/decaprenyl-phosphate alpha-N-acetylglucosaminyl 1-phosphate transferase [Clostridia bacterium]
MLYLVIVMSIEGTISLFEEDQNGVKLLGFFFGIIVLGITCFIDDHRGIPPLTKLAGQLIAAIIVVYSGIRIENLDLPFIHEIGLNYTVSIIITLGWLVGITNAINLIDGLDGLSSGIGIISCLSLLMVFSLNGSPIIAILAITALAGALIGFLPFNFNPAKTFIGDVGSNFVGFSLAVISILGVAKTYTAIVIIAPLIVLGLPILDTLWAIVRRVFTGKSIKAIVMPDKKHLHHRLMAKGYTQKQAVLILYAISATLGMSAVILLDSGIWKALSFLIMVVAVVAIGYKNIFSLAENNEKEEKKDD